MKAATLSPAALALFRQHVELGRTIDLEANRAVYEELARAGLMVVGNSYAKGQNSIYTVTKKGFEERAALLACAEGSGLSTVHCRPSTVNDLARMATGSHADAQSLHRRRCLEQDRTGLNHAN